MITYACPRCGRVNLVKNGRDYKGTQKFRCNDCGRYGTLRQPTQEHLLIREYVERAVRERLSLRGIERVFGISRRTVSRWLERWIECLPSLHESLVEGQVDDILELDELWSFVGSKAQQRWLWLELCRRTRQVGVYWLGDRSETSAVHLWEQIPRAYARCRSFSDKWDSYRHVFDYKRSQQG